MTKGYAWDLTADGATHSVECVLMGNKYVLFVDDIFLTNVYRKSIGVGDLQVPVSICGKECLFVVWDEQPDLAVDGMMLGSNRDYGTALEKRQKGHLKVYRSVFWIGVVLLAVVALLAAFGFGPAVGYDDLVIYAVAGVWMVLFGHIKIRRLTLLKNGPIIGKDKKEGADLK